METISNTILKANFLRPLESSEQYPALAIRNMWSNRIAKFGFEICKQWYYEMGGSRRAASDGNILLNTVGNFTIEKIQHLIHRLEVGVSIKHTSIDWTSLNVDHTDWPNPRKTVLKGKVEIDNVHDRALFFRLHDQDTVLGSPRKANGCKSLSATYGRLFTFCIEWYYDRDATLKAITDNYIKPAQGSTTIVKVQEARPMSTMTGAAVEMLSEYLNITRDGVIEHAINLLYHVHWNALGDLPTVESVDTHSEPVTILSGDD